jgi:hypothetical protein
VDRQTTYNGTVGGISGLAGLFPVDPNSGAGYVTITSINGVAVPPIVPPTQVATTASGLAYSRVTRTFNGTVTITNISGTTLTAPTNFQLVLNSLPAGVTLANSTGTFNQCPYIYDSRGHEHTAGAARDRRRAVFQSVERDHQLHARILRREFLVS